MLLNTVAVSLPSSCQTDVALLVSFSLQDLLMFASLGIRLHLHCLLGRGGRDDLSNVVMDAPGSGCSVDNPDNSLIESISLFEGLFQRRVRNHGSCASCNCGISIFFRTLWDCFCGTCSPLFVLCCTTDIIHSVAELNSEMCRLSHLISTWTEELAFAPSRDRQQPC